MIWNIPPDIFSNYTGKHLRNYFEKEQDQPDKNDHPNALPCLSGRNSSLPYEPYSVRQTAFQKESKKNKLISAVDQLVSSKHTSAIYLNSFKNILPADIYKYLEKWSDDGIIQRRHLTTIQDLIKNSDQ